MENIDVSELNKVIIDYVAKFDDAEDEIIYGNERLRKILKDGAVIKRDFVQLTGIGIFKKKKYVTYDENRFEWKFSEIRTNHKELIEDIVEDIYCVIGDGIFFHNNGFAFLNQCSADGMKIMDLEFFQNVRVYDDIQILEVSSPDYEDESIMMFDSSTDEFREKSELIQYHIKKIQELISENLEEQRVRNLESRRTIVVDEIASDEGDSVELENCSDFEKLLKESQSTIISIDRNYIQKFVKVANFLKAKRENINHIYDLLKEADVIDNLEECYKLIKDEKYVYDSVLFHSFGMIASILDGDMVTFFEIYESFDRLNIFNSNWENETSSRLANIERGIDSANDVLMDILYQSHKMEENIVNSINDMSYMTNSSIKTLNNSVSNQLVKIGSSIKLNNVLTGIQIYQAHTINKRRLR